MTEASLSGAAGIESHVVEAGDNADRVAGRILLVVLVLLGLWATAVVKFGVPGLYIPALGLVPVISLVILAITMGR